VEAKAEEAVITVEAAIGVLKKEIPADKILRAPSTRTVNSVAAAMGADGEKTILDC